MTEDRKNKIYELAVNQITKDFMAMKEKANSKNEKLYGFGIGIVGDITGFFSAGNSVESLVRVLVVYGEEFDPYYIWGISEWGYQEGDNTLYQYLETFIYDIEDDNYNSERRDYENILIKALKTCSENGVFGIGEERESIVVYLHYADAFDEDIDDVSSAQINSKASHTLFKDRWNEETHSLTNVIQEKVKALSK